MRLEARPIHLRRGPSRTAPTAEPRGRAGPSPVRRTFSPVTPCGREGCLEVARLGAAYCPLHE
jgi:hypothetical protein